MSWMCMHLAHQESYKYLLMIEYADVSTEGPWQAVGEV